MDSFVGNDVAGNTAVSSDEDTNGFAFDINDRASTFIRIDFKISLEYPRELLSDGGEFGAVVVDG